jgi:Protein of unknown function (DUF1565)
MHTPLSQRASPTAAAALLTLLLAACGGGGGGTTQPPPSGNVTAAGATVTSQDGQAILSVAQGAVSTPVTVSLASAPDAGYEADPQVLPSSVYQLNVSNPTSLEQPAILSIQSAAGAPLLAHHSAAALSMRGRSSNLLVRVGLLGCDSAVDPSANPAAGVTCVYDETLWPTCPSDVPLSFGQESAYYAPAYFTATPGNLGPVIFCQAAPESQPQLALLSLTAKAAVLPTVFSSSTRKASTSLGVLTTALYGLLFDVTSPAVHLNAVVIPIDGSTSKLQLTADATDNLGITAVSFSQWTVSGNPTNSTVVITKTTLASVATGPYTFTSAALPHAQLYDSHYIATAVDGAGNLGVASVFLTEAPPAIATFTATPASLPIGGGAVTLAWTTVGAATLSIDHGVGNVTALSSKSVNLTASTIFTLTATNALGTVTSQVAVSVASASDRYVDAANGLDTNACTQAAPCKTMTRALTGEPSGATVYLADGTYASATEGGGVVTIPDGVTLRAVNPGAAAVVVPLTASGSASLDGTALAQGASCGSITATSATGTPTLTLTGVSITCFGTVTLGGNVKATMTPGALAGGVYTGAVPDGFGPIIGLTGAAQLLIQGGIIDGNHLGQPAFGGALIYHLGTGSLTLDGVTVRNRSGAGLVASSTASIVLQNGTLLESIGTPGDCPTGSAVVVSGVNTVTLDHSQMSNLPASGICVRSGAVATINVLQSTINNSLTAAINAEIGPGSTAAVTLIGSSLINNNIGIDTGFLAASTFDIESSTITGNSFGVEMTGGSLKMRNSTVSNNTGTGLAFFGTVAVDLGTTASPGGNTITGNTTVGLQDNANNNIDAVGNTWTANQQGADANGHYSTAPSYTPVPELGPKSGTNFSISAAFTLDL